MTLLYNQQGQVAMFCDICTKVTQYYSTLQALYEAVHFNLPLTIDAGAAGWCFGPGKKLIGPGYQPSYTIDSKKHACPSCRGTIETLAYKSDWIPHKFDGPTGAIGRPEQTSAAEDSQMNKEEQLFKGPVPKLPRVFPRNEPDFSHDKNYIPYGEQGEEGTG